MSLEDLVAHIDDPEERAEALSRLRHEVARRTRRAAAGPLTKRCPRCDTVKDVDQFGVDRSRPDGFNPYCRACRKK